MSDDREQSEVQTVRVRPVEGRLVRHEVTRQPITEEAEVQRTRAIERAIAAGDLEEVGAAPREQQDEGADQPYVAPERAVDTRLTPDERSAIEEAQLRQMGLEKEKF